MSRKCSKNSVPFIVEKRGDSERAYDVYSRLLEDRIVFLGGEITDEVANIAIAQLLLLDQKSPTQDIYLYINSPGGSVTAGLAIYDTMNYIRPAVATVCVGQAASMAAVLLSAGTKGKRVALPSAKIMIHQPRSNYDKQTLTVTDQEIEVKLIKNMQKDLYTILSQTTGQSYKKIKDVCELDSWFSSEESKKFGLVDSIVFKKK